MDILLAQRLVFAFGVVNFLALSALFLSCRCMGTREPFSRLFRFKAFAKFYKFHCYYWVHTVGLSSDSSGYSHLGVGHPLRHLNTHEFIDLHDIITMKQILITPALSM